MGTDDFLRKKMEEAERFDAITKDYATDTIQEIDLAVVITYLQEVMEGYLFKRIDRPSFVTNDGDSVVRVTNGYFIVKQTLLYDLRGRMVQKIRLDAVSDCAKCGGKTSTSITEGLKEVIALSTESSEEEDLDLRLEKISRSVVINLSFRGKLGSIRRKRLVEKNIEVLDLIINKDSEYADYGYFFTVPKCSLCSESNGVNLDVEGVTFEVAEQIGDELSSDGGVNEERTNQEDIVVLGEEHEDTQSLSNEEFYEIYDRVLEGLKREMPRGKYVGKSFQWVITFAFDYLVQLLETNDPEDEVKYFLKDLLSMGREIGLDQFPELLELQERFGW